MASMPATANLYKRNYCKGEHAECARYLVFARKGREHVPPDLYPGDVDRARELLSD